MGFRGADRGQSEVIGALLIFAVIVAFIGLNQAFLVPQANEEVEFKHSNDVQRDIVDLRAATTEAVASNEPRSRSIDLGIDYPSRFVAINPPPATGTIQTVDGNGGIDAEHDDLELSAVCGTPTDEPETKFLTYQANYNEHQHGLPTTIENTVAYRSTSGDPIYSTGQMFSQGNQINIIRYVGDVDETTSGSVSLDLIPSKTGVDRVDATSAPLVITLPTKLPDSEWDQLIDSSDVTVDEDSDDRDDRVEFEFTGGTYTVRCTTVGINVEPDVTPVDHVDREDGDDVSVNSRNNDIFLKKTGSFDDNTVSVTLKNSGDEDWTLTRGRIPFVTGENHSKATVYEDEDKVATFRIADDFSSFGGVTIPPGDPVKLEFHFDGEFYPGSSSPGNGWFMLNTDQSQEEIDQFATYFIPEGLNAPEHDDNSGDEDDSEADDSVEGPTINTLNVSSEDTSLYEIEWNVSAGDQDLSRVELELIKYNNGKVQSNSNISISGRSASDVTELDGSNNDDHYVRITVFDDGGNEKTNESEVR